MAEHDKRAAAASGGGGGGRGPRQRSATAPSERTRRAEPTRFAAYTLLRAVDEGSYANLEMPTILRRHRLEGRDAAFATELAFGTIRWQGFYDAVIAEAAGRRDRPASTRRCSTCCAWACTSCSGCASRRTPPPTRRWAWPRSSPGPGRAGSSTP